MRVQNRRVYKETKRKRKILFKKKSGKNSSSHAIKKEN